MLSPSFYLIYRRHMYKRSIFWFRQDLRTFDNRWLIRAIKASNALLPIFIFDVNIVPDFWGLQDKKFLFLKEMLLKLDDSLKELGWHLSIYHWNPQEVLPELCKKYEIEAVFSNKSYSTYGTQRDDSIDMYCQKNEIDFFREEDFLLVEPCEVEARKVFTPFYKLWQKVLLGKDIATHLPSLYIQVKNSESASQFLDEHISWDVHPYFSYEFWKKRLESFDFSWYDEYRNALDLDGTSRLSVYIRFGVFSVREVYEKVSNISESFVSELAWREFWQHIAYHFPYAKEYEFQEKRRNIAWKNDEVLFQKWCKWETGYPVVDAAMKQLVETNWMHGRARMIVASFLTKDLLIDWRLWEKFFKKHLLDYDENVNIWNWQWSASVWADPKPLRIFNPCLQSEKFDKKGSYIYKYIPELEWQDISAIHNPLKYNLDYIPLIIDHSEAQREAREVYKKSSA